MELDDLQLFLPEQQARDAMEAFDGDADGHISAEVAAVITFLSGQPLWKATTRKKPACQHMQIAGALTAATRQCAH